MSKLKDSGKRVTYEGGGQREPKPERFDLMSIVALYREARHYNNGAAKYGPRNWQKGVKFSTCINAIIRHTLKYAFYGCRDEDHLSAIRWNAAALAEFEITHPEMNDLCWGQDERYRLPEETINAIAKWLEALENAEKETEGESAEEV